jgi:hypothetical protein
MLGMRISVQEYAAAFADAIVKISVNALVTLMRKTEAMTYFLSLVDMIPSQLLE